tara:strand:- start:645 stop:1184 length:540 start_codon:yes stop_codon:yes gene_type:complete
MACLISKGRGVGCKTAFAGIKNIYILDYSAAIAALSDTAGTVTLPTDNSAEFFKFEVKGGQTSLETTVTSSRENGTTFYESTLNATFQVLDVATQEEIKLLNRGRAHYVIELYPNGAGSTKYLLMGRDNGAEITGGTIVTGAAAGDLQGFTLTAVATEVFPPFFCTVPDIASATPISPA